MSSKKALKNKQLDSINNAYIKMGKEMVKHHQTTLEDGSKLIVKFAELMVKLKGEIDLISGLTFIQRYRAYRFAIDYIMGRVIGSNGAVANSDRMLLLRFFGDDGIILEAFDIIERTTVEGLKRKDINLDGVLTEDEKIKLKSGCWPCGKKKK